MVCRARKPFPTRASWRVLALCASTVTALGCADTELASDADEPTREADDSITVRGDGDVDAPPGVYAYNVPARAEAQADEDDAPADVGATFALLGGPSAGDGESYPQALSASGDVVVGYTGQGAGEHAFRASAAGFAVLPGPNARALGVSPDGALVVGRAAVPDAPGGSAAILWRSDSEFELLVAGDPDVSAPSPYAMYEAAAVLDDGTVYGSCVQSDGSGVSFGCRYTAGQITALGAGSVYAANASHYVGASRPTDPEAAPLGAPSWQGEAIGFVPGAVCGADSRCVGALRGVARSAELAVGSQTVPNEAGSPHPVAFSYGPAQGVVVLPDLPGGADECGATSVSDDGRVVGGHAAGSHGAGAGALWIDGQPVDLHDYVSARGGVIPGDFRLGWVTGVSGDGRVIVGVGVHAPSELYEGYRITLASAP